MYKVDRAWSDTYLSQIMALLNQLIQHLAVISIASDEKDRKCATDFEVNLSGGTIAVRLRRPRYAYRDLTLRAHRDSGMKTELAKIREGHAYRYLYGWIDANNTIAEWMLVDVDRLRASGLLERDRPFYDNRDGTYFIAISAKELQEAGCLIVSQINVPQRHVNLQASLDAGTARAQQVKCYTPRVEQ